MTEQPHRIGSASGAVRLQGVNDRSRGRDARRLAILEIAQGVFLEEGYTAASMSAIAARLGGSKGTLYNYFDSKEALFSAVVQHHCDRMQAALWDTESPEADVHATLHRLGEGYVRLMLSDEIIALHRMVVAESGRFPELGRLLYDAGPRRGQARLSRFIDEAMSAGRLRRADASRAGEQFVDLCLSRLYRPRLWNIAPPPSDAEINENVDAALATFLAAFGAGPGDDLSAT